MSKLEEYALLKLLATEWSLGNPPAQSILNKLQEKYGVKTLLDLDKVIHKIHKQITTMPKTGNIAAKGDGLVIVGLIKAFNHEVIEAKGDAWRKPLYVMLDYATVKVRLVGQQAEISYNVDSPLDEVDYGLRYIEDINEIISETRKQIEVRGDTIHIHIYNPNVMDAAQPVLETYGLEYIGAKEHEDQYVYMFKAKGSVEEAVSIASEVIAVYSVYMSDNIPEPAHPRSEKAIDWLLGRLARVLQTSLVYTKPRYIGVHLHEEANRIDIHVGGRIRITGDPAQVLESVVAAIIALDHNFETTKPERALNEAKTVLEEINKIINKRAMWRQSKALVEG